MSTDMMWDKRHLARSAFCPLEHPGLPILLQHAVNDLQTACSLLQTAKATRSAALAGCCGSVPLEMRPGTMEQAERSAAWVAKYGWLLSSFEWQPKIANTCRPGLDPASNTKAFAGLAAALQQAAATPQGLRLRYCKLTGVDWDADVILQQLPVNSLTSLELSFDFTFERGSTFDYSACEQRLAGVLTALPKLQQLQQLVLSVDEHSYLNVDPLLEPLSSLTNLTSLEVDTLWSLSALEQTPASLLELQYSWQVYDVPVGIPLKLSHLTALTKLTTGHTTDIHYDAKLPRSLKELHCRRLPYADPLLPLRYLRRLDILSCHSTAEELARLSSLTGLTHIGLCYMDSLMVSEFYHCKSEEELQEMTPEAASAAWPAIAHQLRELLIIDPRMEWDCDGPQVPYTFSPAAVAALGSLTALTSLSLQHLQCPEVTPQQLAAALRRCTALQELGIGSLQLQWELVNGLTGDAAVDAVITHEARARELHVVTAAIASLPHLQKLALTKMPFGMHAAAAALAAAAAAAGGSWPLTQLKFEDCGLTDCCLTVLALGLTNLRSLEVQEERYVGDGALPVIARLPLQRLRFSYTSVSAAALVLFIPGWRALRRPAEL